MPNVTKHNSSNNYQINKKSEIISKLSFHQHTMIDTFIFIITALIAFSLAIQSHKYFIYKVLSLQINVTFPYALTIHVCCLKVNTQNASINTRFITAIRSHLHKLLEWKQVNYIHPEKSHEEGLNESDLIHNIKISGHKFEND